jgi:hypothetical protein
MAVFSYLIYVGYLAVIAAILFFAFNGVKKGEIMQFIKVIYALTIMAFIIMVVAFGISAFYEGPGYEVYGYSQSYQAAQEEYARNVFSISYPIGIVFVLLGVTLRPRLDVIRPGLVLGGLGTMIYAIAQTELIPEIRFVGVVIELAILLIIGYRMLLERRIAKDNANA